MNDSLRKVIIKKKSILEKDGRDIYDSLTKNK